MPLTDCVLRTGVGLSALLASCTAHSGPTALPSAPMPPATPLPESDAALPLDASPRQKQIQDASTGTDSDRTLPAFPSGGRLGGGSPTPGPRLLSDANAGSKVFAYKGPAATAEVRCDSAADSLNIPGFVLHAQEEQNWCWAAASQMALASRGVTVRQCDIATAGLNAAADEDPDAGRPRPSDCCSEREQCDVASVPHFMNRFIRKGEHTTSFDSVKAEVLGRRLVIVSWRYKGGEGGHSMVAHGWARVGGIEFLRVADPLPRNKGCEKYISRAQYTESPTTLHERDDYLRAIDGGLP
jgi:Peptidase_C39 like family